MYDIPKKVFRNELITKTRILDPHGSSHVMVAGKNINLGPMSCCSISQLAKLMTYIIAN